MNKIGKIKRYRQKLGLTQQNVAEYFGITSQAYNQKELGKRRFSKDEMLAFKLLVNKNVDPTATIDDIFFSDTPPGYREDFIVEKIDALIQKLETIKGGNK